MFAQFFVKKSKMFIGKTGPCVLELYFVDLILTIGDFLVQNLDLAVIEVCVLHMFM